MHFSDDNGEVDRRYEIGDLYAGWEFRSPAGRWETVTRVEAGEGVQSYQHRVWTDWTGDGYSWRFARRDKVDAVPPRAERSSAEPEVRVVDLSRGRTPRMVAVLTFRHVAIPDFAHTLAEAAYLGHGKGWDCRDRPNGGDLVITEHPSKAKARSALMAAARAHGKALKVPVRTEDS